MLYYLAIVGRRIIEFIPFPNMSNAINIVLILNSYRRIISSRNKCIFFFRHTTCESTCDTLSSSAANQGDNSVSVAQGGTTTPGTTNIYIYIYIYILYISFYIYSIVWKQTSFHAIIYIYIYKIIYIYLLLYNSSITDIELSPNYIAFGLPQTHKVRWCQPTLL